jgi:uncharacterized protein YdeI (YjbR/CyaY-like superfamily)
MEQIYHAETREGWRRWLEKHHENDSKVFLISWKKHTGKPSISHREAMEEAICFGWIDTTVKRIDEDRYGRYFMRRTDKSRWSNAILGYARQMIKDGRMAPAGLKRYKEGLLKPVIDHGLPRYPPVSKELVELLGKDDRAKAFFEGLAPSYRRFFIYHIEKAKLSETRVKRAKWVLEKCRKGEKF